MGIESLKKIVTTAHKQDKGVIVLCHMSAPEAKDILRHECKISK